jgi:flagellum-specific ATP synthase
MNYEFLSKVIKDSNLITQAGRLTSVHGMVVEATGCKVQHGELVKIKQATSGQSSFAEVVGLRENKILLMPFGSIDGLCLDSTVVPLGSCFSVPVGAGLLGRVINALGEPLDDKGAITSDCSFPSHGQLINPLKRDKISELLSTGVKAIDIFTPIGKGQRIGIFAGSGVGKSTLLGMIAKFSEADIIVIALIGERGREVGDFIRNNLGVEGLKRAVLVVATAAEPAVMRRQAAFSATAIAEWFRTQNKNVLLIMDSITRFAMAQREIGLSIGEPMGSRGYPSSSITLLPPLIERAGNLTGQGSISAVYTVLVEGDDFNEPISDHMRAILDGHIILDRQIATRGQFPAIDILNSISRLGKSISTAQQSTIAASLKSQVQHYEQSRELIDLGLYKPGTSLTTDVAIEIKSKITDLLSQSDTEASANKDSWASAEQIYQHLGTLKNGIH